jgi:hypothetical protein
MRIGVNRKSDSYFLYHPVEVVKAPPVLNSDLEETCDGQPEAGEDVETVEFVGRAEQLR